MKVKFLEKSDKFLCICLYSCDWYGL